MVALARMGSRVRRPDPILAHYDSPRSEMGETIDQLIQELEQRCPGCSFCVSDDRARIHIIEYGRKFTVDLTRLGETAETWLKTEIERHPLADILPLEPDEKYQVICPNCGPQVLGYGRYRDQLGNPDAGWYCPICGENAIFDDETYETYTARGERAM